MGRKGKKHKVPTIKKPPRAREEVMIAVPTMNNSVNVRLHEFIMMLERAQHGPSCPFTFSFSVVNGLHPHEYARNVIVGKFLKSDASRLWFIDQDMMPDTTAARLLHNDADICAGRMLRFDHENPEAGTSAGIALCAMVKANNDSGRFYPLVPTQGASALIEVDAVGTGSMLIRRHVLEDRRMWSDGAYTDTAGKAQDCSSKDDHFRWAPPVFRFPRAPNGRPIMGEDIDFCKRAKELGYRIVVDLLAKVGHYKSVDLDQVMLIAHESVERAADPEFRKNIPEEAVVSAPESRGAA